jgi:hypothetical protein
MDIARTMMKTVNNHRKKPYVVKISYKTVKTCYVYASSLEEAEELAEVKTSEGKEDNYWESYEDVDAELDFGESEAVDD